ncbi:MAG TPA: outer membrane protein transport protein [Ensifer sp.]|nr:outer membrane protein transport protein [Ensifer sp.]
MTNKQFNFGLVAALGAVLCASTAFAGGFSRGDANTDVLFDGGKANIDAGFVYVSPQVKYDTINGQKTNDGRFTDDYWIPNIAVAVRPADVFGCALTYTQSFGAGASYGADARNAELTNSILAGGRANANYTISKGFTSNEYGATCDVKFDAGKGKFHVLGGLFLEDFSYTAQSLTGTLNLNDNGSVGYRLGAAYEIPEYAMRASVMYRSEVKHNAGGSYTFSSTALAANPLLPSRVSAAGAGTLPQSVKVYLQTGIAPDWLVYGSVEWTDWSVLQTLNYTVGTSPRSDKYYWNDGWTIQGGIGHKFNDTISGTLNVTWDKGVGSGADIQTDTWTFGAGALINAGPGQFKVGGGVTYITGGSQSVAKGATFNATTSGSWAYAVGASYNIKF